MKQFAERLTDLFVVQKGVEELDVSKHTLRWLPVVQYRCTGFVWVRRFIRFDVFHDADSLADKSDALRWTLHRLHHGNVLRFTEFYQQQWEVYR